MVRSVAKHFADILHSAHMNLCIHREISPAHCEYLLLTYLHSTFEEDIPIFSNSLYVFISSQFVSFCNFIITFRNPSPIWHAIQSSVYLALLYQSTFKTSPPSSHRNWGGLELGNIEDYCVWNAVNMNENIYDFDFGSSSYSIVFAS